jgi:acetyltransferase-like isoleucine patch superfamily enzyme
MAKKILDSLYDDQGGFLTKYKRIRVGDAGWGTLVLFELVTLLFGNLPGALGLLLRSKLYPPFFKSVGRGVVFGAGVVIRNPAAISIGAKTIIDDHAVLDAKGGGPGREIVIGERAFISRNVVLGCKAGDIRIGDRVTLGPNTIIHAIETSRVVIGNDSVIAANVYLIGAPNYRTERTDIPMAKQGFVEGKGITVGPDVWLGASVVVLDGATIGRGCIVGAMALVRGELPPFAIAHGIPAKVRSLRPETAPEQTAP